MIRAGLFALGLLAPAPLAAFDITGTWSCEEDYVNGVNRGRMTASSTFHADGRHESGMRLDLSGGGNYVQAEVALKSRWDVVDGRLNDRPEQVSIVDYRLNGQNALAGPEAAGLHAALMRGSPENPRIVPLAGDAFALVHDAAARRITCSRAQGMS